MMHLLRPGNIVSLGVASLFAWASYSLVLDTEAPLAVSGAEVLNAQPVPRNAALRIRYAVTVVRRCSGVGQRLFVDAGGVPQPVIPFRVNTGLRADGAPVALGDPFDETIEVPVPNGAAPGHATYANSTVFFCNFWQGLLHRGIAFDYPAVGFEIGDKVLPQVGPSTSIFRHSFAAEGLGSWVRRKIGWATAEEGL